MVMWKRQRALALTFGLFVVFMLVCSRFSPENYWQRLRFHNYTILPGPKKHFVVPNETNAMKSASTGGSFSGIRTRLFEGTLRLQGHPKGQSMCTNFWPIESNVCDKWAVVTTINSPTSGVRSVAALEDWCMVIVSDTKTRSDYLQAANFSGKASIVFLSENQQRQIRNEFVEMIPFRSFARKNVGFLFAIQHGAKVIYDFDDDNVIKDVLSPFSPVDNDVHSQFLLLRHIHHGNDVNGTLSFNPLPHMRPSVEHIWPRGFPLNDVMHQPVLGSVGFGSINVSSVGVVQAVCDGDPDFDAIYRLTRKLPVTFESDPKMMSRLLVPTGKYTPYNAQATVHMYKAFWGLLLPFTVPGRVTDIWRSFVAQKFFHELGLALIYEGPLVKHDRSPHDYLADFQAELELYLKTTKLLEFLSAWKYQGDQDEEYYLPARIERLTIDLYEREYIGLEDVNAMQAWLLALLCSGYVFPSKNGMQKFTVQTEPSIENQTFLTSPAFNVGRNGRQYSDEDEALRANTSLSEWMELNGPAQRPSEETVLKIVLMNKDELPLLKDWVWYHGALLGFQNLYIVDGSSESQSIQFLAYVRDHYGVNVIFSSATMQNIESQMTKIGRHAKKSCDLLIKMDTDEFLVANKGSPNCENVSVLSPIGMDCSLSPYAVKQTLKTIRASMDGERLAIGFQDIALPPPEVCNSSVPKFDVSAYKHAKRVAGGFKAISDSRTFAGFDLGGHNNYFVRPFGRARAATKLGVIHAKRCQEEQFANDVKTVASHGFIQQDDTYERIQQKFRSKYNLTEKVDVCGLGPSQVAGVSWHKILKVWKYVAGCKQPQESTSNLFQNLEFVQFLRNARAMYEPNRSQNWNK